jgi:hypothetical protein
LRSSRISPPAAITSTAVPKLEKLLRLPAKLVEPTQMTLCWLHGVLPVASTFSLPAAMR